MEFLARLIGGSTSSTPKSIRSQSPQQGLVRFKGVYGQLLRTWQSSTSSDPLVLESVRTLISKIACIVQEESTTPVPHPCLAFAASSQIYVNLSKIASRSRNDAIVRETVAAISALIDSEEEDFLENETFSQSLMHFVSKAAGVNALTITRETESDLVELLFGIAAKIRLQPDILPAWFFPRKTGQTHGFEARQEFDGATHKEDFPLFYILIDYVHNEGRIGDFARLGLLYIIESASNSEALEQWLVESDLATLMASGLGALYSQLSRKLVTEYAKEDMPAILVLSDYSCPHAYLDVESTASVAFRSHLSTFLSYLAFWQDALEYCKSCDLKQTLLDHFQVLFLQQLLYPSLLESSDADGGSSVAVLTYLHRILDTLGHQDLIHLILQYLLALPEHVLPRDDGAATPKSQHSSRRRKSLEMLSSFAGDQERPSPDLFNLVDLMLTSLRSAKQQTVTASLKLLSVILQQHHRYAVGTFTQIVPIRPEMARTLGAHNLELRLLLSLAEEIGGSQADLDESYDNHLHDIQILLEEHACNATILDPKRIDAISKKQSTGSISGSSASRELYHHSIRPEDPLLQTLLSILETFWSNSVETNLSLTAALIDLASCGYTRLEGWLLLDPAKYDYTNSAIDLENEEYHEADVDIDVGVLTSHSPSPTTLAEQRRIHALESALQEPVLPVELTPLLSSLRTLIRSLPLFTSQIPSYTAALAAHENAFRVSSELSDALTTSPLATPHQMVTAQPKPISPSPPATSSPAATALDSISARIFSTPTPSRSRASSPAPQPPQRGRTPNESTSAVAPAISGRLQPSFIRPPSPSPVFKANRAFSPSPLRRTNAQVEFEDSDTGQEDGQTSPTDTDTGANANPISSTETRSVVPRHIKVPAKTSSSHHSSDLPRSHQQSGKVASSKSLFDGVVRNEPTGTSTDGTSDTSSILSGSDGRTAATRNTEDEQEQEVSTGLFLTNVILMREFLLEIAALVQVRASLFDDIRPIR